MKDALITWTLINVVLPMAAMVVMAILGKMAQTINRKYNLDIQQHEVDIAVRAVEQIAERAIKNNQSALSSSEKLSRAMDYVNKAMPGQDQEVLKKRIEASVKTLRERGGK